MHLLVDQKGLPLWITTNSAKGNERDQALILLNQMIEIQIKDSKEMTICEADKGYDSKAFRQALLSKGYLPIIG